MKTLKEVQQIVKQVQFQDREFVVHALGNGFYLQVQYREADIETGVVEKQYARKWYIEPDATETQIVETAFKACRTSMEHVLKEHFTYQGRRVYSPHFDIKARLALCDAECFDGNQKANLEALQDNTAVWEDQPLPGDDEAIKAAHPTRSGKHALYQEARRLVGARRSKGGLVDLVNWLLVDRDRIHQEAVAGWRTSLQMAIASSFRATEKAANEALTRLARP